MSDQQTVWAMFLYPHDYGNGDLLGVFASLELAQAVRTIESNWTIEITGQWEKNSQGVWYCDAAGHDMVYLVPSPLTTEPTLTLTAAER
jgi:hypothetical protein